MKFLNLVSILFLSANCFSQPNYKATVFNTDISSVNYYWYSHNILTENVFLFNAEDKSRNSFLYAYNLENNAFTTGEGAAPWHNNMPLEKIYEVNGTRVMFSVKNNQFYKFTKDSLVYASPYFSPNNPSGFHIQLISADDIVVFKNKLYFQAFIVPNDALNPCGGEAALMTWDGVNAPTTAPLVYFGHSSCYTTGNDNNPGNRFFIKNFSVFHDTLFYSGGRFYDGNDFYYLDKNDSSIVAIPKGNAPSDIEFVLKTYVVGDYMYFWAILKNGKGCLFKHKGINEVPEKVNITTNDTPTDLNAFFYGDKLFIRSYIDAVAYPYLIYPDGTITIANNLENFYNTINNNDYVIANESPRWEYVPINDLNATPLPATELNNLTYYNTTSNGSSPNGITIEASGLSYLGVDGDWIAFRQTTYHRRCPDTNGFNPCDTILYKINLVIFGPSDKSPLKPKDPFFEDCNVSYTMDVKHIADCSATDFPSDSKTTGEITLTLTGNQTSYEVTWYKSDDKKIWSALNTTTVSGAHKYAALSKGFYKASINTTGGCVIQTPYYEIKSLIGISKKAYEESIFYYKLDAYGSLPVNITFITPNDTTETAIGFEFIDKYRVRIPFLEGQNFLIHTDLSGCRNIDTFTVGITVRNIKSELFCDSSRFFFDVARGVPPFKVTITEQYNTTTDTILAQTYNTFFHFDKKIHRNKMASLDIIVEDAVGEKSYGSSFKYTPTITFPNPTSPNCGGRFKSGGHIVANVGQSNTLAGEPYVYSWEDGATIDIPASNSDPLFSINVNRDVSNYGDYTFQIKDTVYGCIYKNTLSFTDPFINYHPDLDSIYEVCGNKNIQITSTERMWFSSNKDMSTSNGVGNTLYFYDSKEIFNTTIYYAPFNTSTGCFASQKDSFIVKSFEKTPILSDTIICVVGDTISFTAKYDNTEWYVDFYNPLNPPLFTGKVFKFKTTSLNHTIYAILCDALFDEVSIKYKSLNALQITSDFLADSIITCKAITLFIENKDTDAVVYWISPLDTVSDISSYSIPIPYTASIYAIQQIENCKSAVSNSIYVDRYQISSPILYVSGDSLYTNIPDSISWYVNGQYIAQDKNSFVPATSGYYHIVVEDKNGCTATSNSVFFEIERACNCVYPVPTYGKVFFDYAELESVTLYNSVGAEISSYTTNTIDLTAFASAMYIAKIKLKDGSVKIEKIIKY